MRYLDGGNAAWRAAGLPLTADDPRMADEPIDAWLKPYERPDGVQAGDGGLSRVGDGSAAAHCAGWVREV